MRAPAADRREPDESGNGEEEGARRWSRALVLLLALWVTSALPSGPLIAVPLLAQLVLLPRPRMQTALILAMLAAAVAASGQLDGFWYLTRGWALLVGLSFVAATRVSPTAPFVGRALAAVFAAVALAGLIFATGWADWAVVDWMVAERLDVVGTQALESIRALRGGDLTAAPTLMTTVARMIEWQQSLYPGVLLVSSLCALGVAWWLYVRWAQGSDRGLGPLRDFRFNDQLIWIVVLGVALVLWGSEAGTGRAGANLLVLMAALYLARGAGVVVFLSGGVSIGGMALAVLGLVVLPAVMVSGAVAVGLTDTWLDIRGRARAALEG